MICLRLSASLPDRLASTMEDSRSRFSFDFSIDLCCLFSSASLNLCSTRSPIELQMTAFALRNFWFAAMGSHLSGMMKAFRNAIRNPRKDCPKIPSYDSSKLREDAADDDFKLFNST